MIDDATLQRVMPKGAVDLIGDLLRATLWMLLIVGLLTFAGVYLRLAWLLLSQPGSNDFTIFYYTARMVSDGHPMYGDLPTGYGVDWKGAYLGNLNPPHFQLLVAPLVPLGYRGALVAWLLANLAVVAAAARLTIRELRPVLTLKRILLTILLVFASAAWTSVAVTGEMSLVLLLPFTGAWIAARRGRWQTAGALLGICASLKLFFLVFAAWLAVGRRWRALAAFAGGAAALIAVGAAIHGIHSYADWLRGLSRVAWWWLPMNVSVRGLTERMLANHGGYAAVADAPGLARPVWLALAGVVVVLTVWRTWPLRPRLDADRTLLILLIAALLVSPLGWVYYLPLATGPLIGLAVRRELTGPTVAWTLVLLGGLAWLYVPMEVTELGQPSRVATLVLASSHSWGALLLWIALLARPATTHDEPVRADAGSSGEAG